MGRVKEQASRGVTAVISGEPEREGLTIRAMHPREGGDASSIFTGRRRMLSQTPWEKRVAHYVSALRYTVIGCFPASRDRWCSTGSQRRMSIVPATEARREAFSISAATPSGSGPRVLIRLHR